MATTEDFATYGCTTDQETTVLLILKQFLPYSLCLYRRIQSSHRSPSARIILTHPLNVIENVKSSATSKICFGISFIDRGLRPETENYPFLSSQVPGNCPDECSSCDKALLAIMNCVSNLPIQIPISSTQQSKELAGHVNDPDLHLAGAVDQSVHARILRLQIRSNVRQTPDIPYSHMVFQSTDEILYKVDTDNLPAGLFYGPLTETDDYELVISRTSIPRQIATLKALKSTAIFQKRRNESSEAVPVAWGFIGVDGCLTSLHVEEQLRGQGLAKKVAAKLVKESMGGQGYGHAHVATDNVPSQAVCRSVGGTSSRAHYWVLIDLAKVRTVINRGM